MRSRTRKAKPGLPEKEKDTPYREAPEREEELVEEIPGESLEEPLKHPMKGYYRAYRPGASGIWMTSAGILFVLASLVTFGLSNTQTPISQHLKNLSIHPEALFALGVLLIAIGKVMSSVKAMLSGIHELEKKAESVKKDHEFIRTGLADLGSIDVAAKLTQIASGMAPSEIQAALMKMDEKLNNLTKATRVLTQPLQELSTTESKLGEKIDELRETAKEVLGASQTAIARLEELGTGLPARTSKETKEALSNILQENSKRTAELAGEIASKNLSQGIEGLKEIISGIEESLAGVRLGVTERISQELQAMRDTLASILEKLSSMEKKDSESQEIKAIAEVLQILNSVKEKLQSEVNVIAATGQPEKPEPRPEPPQEPSVQPDNPKNQSTSVLSAIEKLKRMRGM